MKRCERIVIVMLPLECEEVNTTTSAVHQRVDGGAVGAALCGFERASESQRTVVAPHALFIR